MDTRPPGGDPATTSFNSAFTLVEVLIVVLIIGILAAVAVPKLVDTREDVVASAIMTSLDVIQDQIDTHTRSTEPAAIPRASTQAGLSAPGFRDNPKITLEFRTCRW